MASYRIPRKKAITFQRSHCPKCGHILEWKCLIPIFSYLFQAGKCRYCKKEISLRYLITEIVSSVLFVAIYLKFGFGYDMFLFMFLATCLMVIVIADLENYVIPDRIQVLVLMSAFLYLYLNKMNLIYHLSSGLIYMVFGLLLYFSFLLFLDKKAIGFGDIKFMGICGLFLGLHNITSFLLLSGIMGVLFGITWKKLTRSRVFPFGPVLAIVLFFLLFFDVSIFQNEILIFN